VVTPDTDWFSDMILFSVYIICGRCRTIKLSSFQGQRYLPINVCIPIPRADITESTELDRRQSPSTPTKTAGTVYSSSWTKTTNLCCVQAM